MPPTPAFSRAAAARATILMAALCVACSPMIAQAQEDTPTALNAAPALKPGDYRWASDEGPSATPVSIIVSIDRQQVYVYRGDRLIGQATASTGARGHATPLGEFSVLQKNRWHRSNLYSNAPMPFMQRLTWDGIALHAGHLPGYPASHGCIRLPTAFAEKLFGMTSLGTRVAVMGRFGAPPVYLRFDDIDWIVTADRTMLGGAPVRQARDPHLPHWAPIEEIEAARQGKRRLDYDPAVTRE